MTKNKTNFILVIVSLTFLVLVGVFVYFLNLIKNKNNHTSAVLTTLDQNIAEKENISVLRKKMEELGDTRDKLGEYFVNPARIDTFVEFLEKLGTDNNVDLSVKSVEIPKGEKNKILINLSLVGDFSNIMKVTYLLENVPYNITISSLYLNKDLSADPQVVDPVKKTNTLPVVLKKSAWQAEIKFNALSL